MTKVYGVDGLMQWRALIPSGGAWLPVDFSGGSMSGYGPTPAEYSTADPVVQRVIEESEYFREGRIRLLRCETRGGGAGCA